MRGEIHCEICWVLLLFSRAVTRFAFQRGGFVKNNGIAVDQFHQRVTRVAWDAFVPAGQGELGFLVMVEGGRFPTLLDVTCGASGGSVLDELAFVRIFVAAFAQFSNTFERNLGASRRSFVTRAAGNRAMRAT